MSNHYVGIERFNPVDSPHNGVRIPLSTGLKDSPVWRHPDSRRIAQPWQWEDVYILFMGATHDRLIPGGGDFRGLEKCVISYYSFLRKEAIRQRRKMFDWKQNQKTWFKRRHFRYFLILNHAICHLVTKPGSTHFDCLNDMQFSRFLQDSDQPDFDRREVK